MKPSEYISSDILEKDHLKSFSPLRTIQMITGSCRVDAKYRFVSSPTKAQKIYTVIYLLIILSFYISMFYNYLPKLYPYPNVYYLSVTALFLHYGTFMCNVIHVRFLNNDCNVKFYIRMQDIDRKMKIDQAKIFNNFLFKTNLVTIAMTLLVVIFLFTIAMTENVGISLFVSFMGPILAQFTCSLEWLHAGNLLIYFHFRLRYVNAIMINHIKGTADINVNNVKKKNPTANVLRSLASETHDFPSSDTDVYLKNIFEELLRFQRLYRFQIFSFSLKFVTMTLLMFEFELLGLQYNILQSFELTLLPTVAGMDLIIIIVICIRCEVFFGEIKHTKNLCIKIMSVTFSGPIRQKAIKMLKMIKEKPPQFSVYDMWHMDASTMISMINLVTTLMVTLLQFALL